MDLVEALTRHFGGAEGGPESPDAFTDRIVNALAAGAAAGTAAGHQATGAERSAAYERYAQLRNAHYGQPPAREQIRNSLSPDSAGPVVRRIFGGGRD
jgi:hypothetical protein